MVVTLEWMRAFEVVVSSMTETELTNPRSIAKSQIERVARGSGKSEEQVRELLEQHGTMKKLQDGGLDGTKPFGRAKQRGIRTVSGDK